MDELRPAPLCPPSGWYRAICSSWSHSLAFVQEPFLALAGSGVSLEVLQGTVPAFPAASESHGFIFRGGRRFGVVKPREYLPYLSTGAEDHLRPSQFGHVARAPTP